MKNFIVKSFPGSKIQTYDNYVVLNKNVILWYLKRQSSAIHLFIQQIFEHPLYIKGQRYSAQETAHVLMELYGGGKTDKQTIKS